MRPWLVIRRFVDRDLARTGYVRSGSRSLTIAVLIMCIPLPFVVRPYSMGETIALAFGIAGALAWLAFVLWRAMRSLMTSAIYGDRDYDRHGRHRLSSDYAETESATRANRRR